jgi:beta-N-acetylhexosaminidase
MRKYAALIVFEVLFLGAIGYCGGEELPAAEKADIDFKIGQMLMVGFRGDDVNSSTIITEDIRRRNVGGVILFDYDYILKTPRNITSPAQLHRLTEKLQVLTPYPLLIAVDQEGGRVRRLHERNGFEGAFSAEYLGGVNDLSLTYKQASKIARQLSQMGINLNFAPVVDLDLNPSNQVIGGLERSFSADPNIVIAHAIKFIEAHHQQGVLCSIKHFPGHGSSFADSHFGFVDVTKTWSPVELKPYEEIIKMRLADTVMTAHVFNANLDANNCATLSKPIVTGLLRGKIGYDGVVISDCMNMQAIGGNYTFEEAIRRAIEAGVDIILISNNMVYDEDVAGRAVAVIKKFVKDGQITQGRIDESYRRIRGLKGRIAKQSGQN